MDSFCAGGGGDCDGGVEEILFDDTSLFISYREDSGALLKISELVEPKK